MRRDHGSALVVALFVSLLVAGIASALVVFETSLSRASWSREQSTRAVYSAETGLARALHDLAQGGIGEVDVIDLNGLSVTTEVAEEDGVTVITSTAKGSSPDAYAQIQGYAKPTTIQVPKVAAVYVPPGATLTLNGQSLSIDGQETFALATAEDDDGSNYDALLEQIDVDDWDNLEGLEGPPSIGEVPEVDLDDLYSTLLFAVDNTNMGMLGTEEDPHVSYHDGDLQLSGNRTGSGVLIVNGDLSFTGKFSFVGLVVVRGSITLSGGGDQLFVIGSLLATDGITLSGTADVFYDSELLGETETLVNSQINRYELIGYVRK